MAILLGTVFIASLLGSLHCVGMCGPFALLAGSSARSRGAAVVPTLAYSFGRLVTYSMMGILFGSLGMAINRSSVSIHHWQQSATWLAGALMILVGLIGLIRWWGVAFHLPSFVQPLQRGLKCGFQLALTLKPLPKAIVIGMLTSLMPCGWLYTFGISAAGTGSPWLGLWLMIAFWAGTVPIMAALMLGINRIGNRIQRPLPAIMAGLVILIGVFTLAFRAPLDLSAMTQQMPVIESTETLVQQIQNIDQSNLPCCQHQ
jgi:sulfite exporter TauE/SafE